MNYGETLVILVASIPRKEECPAFVLIEEALELSPRDFLWSFLRLKGASSALQAKRPREEDRPLELGAEGG